MVVAPDGRVLLDLGKEPGVDFVKIDLQESNDYRLKIPNLKNIVMFE